MKSKGRQSVTASPVPVSTRPTPAPVMSHAGPAPALFSESPSSASIPRFSSQYVSGLAPVPTRFDAGVSRRPSVGQHAPAPFLADAQAGQKHEFTEQLPGWARKLEDLFVMRQIVSPLVKALDESDAVLANIFSRFGFRLGRDLFLTDRFLPSPLCNEPTVTSEWQRRQLLESMVTLPDFPPQFRDYAVERIKAWASRSGLRFGYRHDFRQSADGPTDSHILAHLVFTALEAQMGGTFKDRYVVDGARGAAAVLGDEFSALFSSVGSRISGGGHHSRVVWLEQTARKGAPLHFNVGTNQRTLGVPAGGGNLIEALCLFFHLLKRLSPSGNWLQIPADVRQVVEAAVGAEASNGLTSALFGGLASSKPALGAPTDFYRGY